jgi:hypothetical protein
MGRVQNLLRTAAEWTEDNPILSAGQTGVEKFTNKSKTGNGTSPWANLNYNSTAADRVAVAMGDLGATPTLPDTLAGGVLVTGNLNVNATPVFPTLRAGASFDLVTTQTGGGSHTVTWPAAVKWSGGTAPTLTTTANKRDSFHFVCDGANWLGSTNGLNY